MITTPYFTIGHIGKTGGDAIKQICAAVFEAGLESNYSIDTIFGNFKHRKFTGNEKIRILSFRRLPSFILSIAQHDHNLEGRELWTPEFCSTLKNGDNFFNKMTSDCSMKIHDWIRCESLRDDLSKILFRYYGDAFIDNFIKIVRNTPTKPSMYYNRNVKEFFTPEQLIELYKNNPIWTEIELQLYGNLIK